MFTLNNLTRHAKATHKKKVVGRGRGTGHGKFSTRGNKGQTKRTGHSKLPATFEGGRTPLVRQLPKLRGFKSLADKALAIPLDKIAKHFSDGDTVTLAGLQSKGLVPKSVSRVKILAGKTTKRFKLEVPASETVKKAVGQ